MNNVIKFPIPDTEETIDIPLDGDGEGPYEIVVRVIHEYPEEKPEPKSSGAGAFILGGILGLLWGG